MKTVLIVVAVCVGAFLLYKYVLAPLLAPPAPPPDPVRDAANVVESKLREAAAWAESHGGTIAEAQLLISTGGLSYLVPKALDGAKAALSSIGNALGFGSDDVDHSHDYADPAGDGGYYPDPVAVNPADRLPPLTQKDIRDRLGWTL